MAKLTDKQIQDYADENRALARFRRAQADLYDNAARDAAAGVTEETDEYLRLNQAVIDTGKALPKRLRYLNKGI